MPPVDLETLIRSGGSCVGGDGKVVCETLIDSHLAAEKPDVPVTPPDFPAESFRLPKEDVIEWFDRNAFYERKQSTRGNANSGPSHGSNLNPNSSNSSSQRISVKSKAQILGLPKLPDSGQLRRTFRQSCRPPSIRFFPKQGGKQAADPPLTEPSSPKVSCIGRVRSKRDKRLRRSKRRDDSGKDETKAAKKEKKQSLWRSLRSMLRFCGHQQERSVASDGTSLPTGFPPGLGENSAIDAVQIALAAKPTGQSAPPSLGDLRRFSSGRRSASWGGLEVELEMDAGAATKREPFKTAEVWRRRTAVPPDVIHCQRDLHSVGPATL
ncbi:uncharacterized protein [Aristolochia californica]|uniref:uncharacterized protein n=1 Tax=Aristolochia californica TaxID=171875 RepID=UPI0035DD2829